MPPTLAIGRCAPPSWKPLGEIEKRPRGVLKPIPRSWVAAVARSFDAALDAAP